MILEPTGLERLSEITALQRRYDEHWFGEPENDADEVQEWLELGDRRCLVRDGDRVAAAATVWRTGSSVVIDPGADVAAAAALIVPWLAEAGAPTTEVFDRDAALRGELLSAGWRYAYSSFDLFRAVDASWTLPAPTWPAGLQVRRLEPPDERALHDLIYRDAAWADVPGHHVRDFDEWRAIFLKGDRDEERPLLAARDDRLVGAVLPRLFSDGVGWIAQLAVAGAERGRGLGRALLLAGFDGLVRAGASKLGLGVLAENESALRLYVGIGLRVDREWQTFAAPA